MVCSKSCKYITLTYTIVLGLQSDASIDAMAATEFGDVTMTDRGVYTWRPAMEISVSTRESHQRCRLKIGELALFYRGAIIVAHKITMNSDSIDHKLKGDDARRLKFASLLQ
jgi:hypothetical protein